MACIIIGSEAIGKYIPGFRKPKDLDLFTDEPGKIGDCFWHPKFDDWCLGSRYASLNELLTIKLSHAAWDVGSWEKHMDDIVELQVHGAEVIEPLYDMLYSVWEERHGAKVVNLDQDKEEFFSDAVRRTYDHDSIHCTVAYGDRPLYEQFIAEGNSVLMDMKKVWAADYRTQVNLFREEVLATALERLVIPSGYTYSPGKAYRWALKRTITSLTKGRSSRFMAENYHQFRKPDPDYVERHKSRAHLLVPV